MCALRTKYEPGRGLLKNDLQINVAPPIVVENGSSNEAVTFVIFIILQFTGQTISKTWPFLR